MRSDFLSELLNEYGRPLARYSGTGEIANDEESALVAGEIGLQLPEGDIKLFVQCRNSLVHRGDFYCNTASQEEREDVPPKASYVEEYFFMLSVVDAFLLRLVGYSGQYLVRTRGPEGGELRSL